VEDGAVQTGANILLQMDPMYVVLMAVEKDVLNLTVQKRRPLKQIGVLLTAVVIDAQKWGA
jgi:hypothetical protein